MADVQLRTATDADFAAVAVALRDWWQQPGLNDEHTAKVRIARVPRLWFSHFAQTSFVAEIEGTFVGFLVGFLSPGQPNAAYVHFVGVSPERRESGIGRRLYERFFEVARAAGRTQVQATAAPVNRLSIDFHRGMGFQIEPGQIQVEGVSATADYEGPGNHRIRFVRTLSI